LLFSVSLNLLLQITDIQEKLIIKIVLILLQLI